MVMIGYGMVWYDWCGMVADFYPYQHLLVGWSAAAVGKAATRKKKKFRATLTDRSNPTPKKQKYLLFPTLTEEDRYRYNDTCTPHKKNYHANKNHLHTYVAA